MRPFPISHRLFLATALLTASLLAHAADPAIADRRPKLVKLPTAIGPNAMENSPVVFQNRPLLILNRRDDTLNKTDGYTKSMYLYALDLTTGREVARFGEGHSFANAYVNGTELNVFAS